MQKTLVLRRKPALKAIEVAYRKAILSLVRYITEMVNSQLMADLQRYQSEYVRDDYSDDISIDLERLKQRWRDSFGVVDRLSESVARTVYNKATWTIEEELQKRMGVNALFKHEQLIPTLKIKARENAALVKNIGDDYIDKITTAVFEGVSKGLRASEIQKDIEKLEGITEKRAKFIAVDQVHKMNTAINQSRYDQLGVRRYIWRTMKDERVRGKPETGKGRKNKKGISGTIGGLYPKAKPSHVAREGEIFSLSSPPEGGHPGEDYGCRCWMEPILPLTELIRGV